MNPTINYKFKDKNFNNTKKKQNNSYKLNYTDMEYIKFIYNKLYEENDNDNDNDNINNTKINILNDCMELFDSQINELYTKQEEMYSLIHTQQQQIEKLTTTLSQELTGELSEDLSVKI